MCVCVCVCVRVRVRVRVCVCVCVKLNSSSAMYIPGTDAYVHVRKPFVRFLHMTWLMGDCCLENTQLSTFALLYVYTV